jgi:two-component system, chemotaxis family, sensor kinase CheA
LHILRNSIDHGIENKETRLKNNKPEKGQIKLKAFYSGANVHISIIDDGKGIDPEKIKQKAIEKGLINSESNLSNQEILNMVFLPGFSTAETVSSVSGRGVGMDVVKRKISDLRGDVEIESEIGKGTTITIKLPLTLSIIDGLLTEIDGVFYIIPLTVVDKIYAAQHDDLVDTYNNLITLDGEQVPFYYMREEFSIQDNNVEVEQIVVVNFENNRIGVAVDKVVGQYQAVLKPLGKHYKGQEFISGASILGDGTVALVMDTNKMIKKLSKN